MDKVKSVFASRTIITNFVTLVASIAAIWGFNLTQEETAYAATVIITVGTLLSTRFRMTATDRVAVSPTKASLNCHPATLVLAILVVLALGACVSGQKAAGIYAAVDAELAAVSPSLYRNCTAVQLLAAAVDPSLSAKHRAAVDGAEAVLASVCASRPSSVPAAIVTVLAAYGALQALQTPARI